MAETVGLSTRRSMLGAAAGAAVAFVASALGRPAPARATVGTFQYGTDNHAGASETFFDSTNVNSTLYISNGGTGRALDAYSANSIGFYGRSAAAGYAATYGINEVGYGVIGDAGFTSSQQSSLAGVWGRHLGGVSSVGTYGTSPTLTGVMGYAAAGAGPAPTAVPALTGVYGYSPAGVGVRAKSDTGTALVVAGKARFSRSGRAYVAANASSVDITPAGGLGTTTVVTATIQTYRAGVAVSGARLNYPTTGVVRIYLTKVASTTGVTPVGWIATEY